MHSANKQLNPFWRRLWELQLCIGIRYQLTPLLQARRTILVLRSFFFTFQASQQPFVVPRQTWSKHRKDMQKDPPRHNCIQLITTHHPISPRSSIIISHHLSSSPIIPNHPKASRTIYKQSKTFKNIHTHPHPHKIMNSCFLRQCPTK